MFRKFTVLSIVFVFVLALAATAYADPGKPNFGPAIYADGEVYGTKGTTSLPAPNGHNNQSFDILYMIEGQDMPVSEAGPGNPMYNGGRWWAHKVEWKEGSIPEELKSYEDIMNHAEDLIITPTNAYFQCPLLPKK
jgi:hypothetical protein